MLKNEKGLAMAMAIIIGLVVTVSGIVVWQVSSSDTMQVARDEDNTQAFFYAKSGVELAVGLLQNDPDYLAHGEESVFYGKLGDTAFSSTETADYTIKFEIERDNNDYIIRSTGIVRSGSALGAQAAASALGFRINIQQLEESTGVGGGGGQMPPLDMIFAISSGTEAININGSSRIEGKTGTNSTAANGVYLSNAGGNRIIGDLLIGPGGISGTVVNRTEKVSGSITNLNSTRNYSLPQFPSFPEFQACETSIILSGSNSWTINSDGCYPKIEVKSNTTLTINTGNGDRIIRVGDLDIAQGHIVLQGTGRLIIYVDNNFNMGGSSTINNNGDFNKVIMYYQGANEIQWTGNQRFFGSVYLKEADLTIGGSTRITGHIVSGAENVEISGNAQAYVRAIYAPHASLVLKQSGAVRGVVVAKDIELIGNCSIIYDDSMNIAFLESLDWGSEECAQTADWRSIGQWQRL